MSVSSKFWSLLNRLRNLFCYCSSMDFSLTNTLYYLKLSIVGICFLIVYKFRRYLIACCTTKKVINIYNSHKSEQTNKVQTEIEKFLTDSHYEPVVVSYDQANKGDTKCPIIVLCSNDSRLKDDIDNALSRIKDVRLKTIIVIVIHVKSEDYAEFGTSGKILHGLADIVLDWDARCLPLFDNKEAIKNLERFLKYRPKNRMA